jgi:hypothetical protein
MSSMNLMLEDDISSRVALTLAYKHVRLQGAARRNMRRARATRIG